MHVAFYSTKSGNTRRFVDQLTLHRLPIAIGAQNAATSVADEPYVLITPTYNGRVPKPVVDFLNVERNRQHLLGVIGGGNTNFGPEFARAARTISAKCSVPLLHVFELTGLPEDVIAVHNLSQNLPWKPLSLHIPSLPAS